MGQASKVMGRRLSLWSAVSERNRGVNESRSRTQVRVRVEFQLFGYTITSKIAIVLFLRKYNPCSSSGF